MTETGERPIKNAFENASYDFLLTFEQRELAMVWFYHGYTNGISDYLDSKSKAGHMKDVFADAIKLSKEI